MDIERWQRSRRNARRQKKREINSEGEAWDVMLPNWPITCGLCWRQFRWHHVRIAGTGMGRLVFSAVSVWRWRRQCWGSRRLSAAFSSDVLHFSSFHFHPPNRDTTNIPLPTINRPWVEERWSSTSAGSFSTNETRWNWSYLVYKGPSTAQYQYHSVDETVTEGTEFKRNFKSNLTLDPLLT